MSDMIEIEFSDGSKLTIPYEQFYELRVFFSDSCNEIDNYFTPGFILSVAYLNKAITARHVKNPVSDNTDAKRYEGKIRLKKEMIPENNHAFRASVGVVTPTKRLFDKWVNETGKKMYGDKYKFIMVRTIEDVVGRSYFAIEKGIRYYEVDWSVYEAAILCICKTAHNDRVSGSPSGEDHQE